MVTINQLIAPKAPLSSFGAASTINLGTNTVYTPADNPQINLPTNYTGTLFTCVKLFPNIRTAFVSNNSFYFPYFISSPDESEDIIAPMIEIEVNIEV